MFAALRDLFPHIDIVVPFYIIISAPIWIVPVAFFCTHLILFNITYIVKPEYGPFRENARLALTQAAIAFACIWIPVIVALIKYPALTWATVERGSRFLTETETPYDHPLYFGIGCPLWVMLVLSHGLFMTNRFFEVWWSHYRFPRFLPQKLSFAIAWFVIFITSAWITIDSLIETELQQLAICLVTAAVFSAVLANFCQIPPFLGLCAAAFYTWLTVNHVLGPPDAFGAGFTIGAFLFATLMVLYATIYQCTAFSVWEQIMMTATGQPPKL